MIDAHLRLHSLSAFAGTVVARVRGVRALGARPVSPQGGASTPAWAMLPNGRGITQ
jgi:hypothetical protein